MRILHIAKVSAFLFVSTLPIILALLIAQNFTHPSWYFNTVSTPEKGLNFGWGSVNWVIDGIKYYNNPLISLNLTYNDVEFDGPHGSTLRGWYIPAAVNSTRGLVLVHGAGMDRREFLKQTPILHNAGYHLLMFDCREHGISSGSMRGFTYGLREHSDVIAAVRYFRNSVPLTKVAVIGTSQGATSTILAASKEDGIDAIVVENPFSSLDELLTDVIDGVLNTKPEWSTNEEPGITAYLVSVGHYVPSWYRNFIKFITTMKLYYLANEGAILNAIDVIGKLHQPLFLIHGSSDSLIPLKHTMKLYDVARDPKLLWVAEKCEHSAIFNKYPKEYAKKVIEFLSTHM